MVYNKTAVRAGGKLAEVPAMLHQCVPEVFHLAHATRLGRSVPAAQRVAELAYLYVRRTGLALRRMIPGLRGVTARHDGFCAGPLVANAIDVYLVGQQRIVGGPVALRAVIFVTVTAEAA
jgi:hypothetical protein